MILFFVIFIFHIEISTPQDLKASSEQEAAYGEGDMALVLDWQKKLGYKKDPFDPAPQTPAKRYIVGLEDIQQRINLFLIKEERIASLSAEQGTGKTTLLKWVDEELAPQKTHAQHYIDAKLMPKADQIIDSLVKSRISLLEKTFSKVTSASPEVKMQFLLKKLASENKNVLIIDNAGSLEKSALDMLQDITVKTPTHIILADTEASLKALEVKAQMHLKLPTYRDDQLAELVQRRIESAGGSGTHPFDDTELHTLFKKSERNPAKLLALARERAIELSLKSAPAPAPEPTKFLTIKVEKKPEAKLVDMTVKEEPVKQAPQPQTVAEVAEALQQIVSQNDKVEEKKAPEPERHVNVSVAHVVRALNKHPRKKVEAVMERPKESKAPPKKTKHDKIVERLTTAKPKKAAKKSAPKKSPKKVKKTKR